MAEQYYYSQDDVQFGPFSAIQMRDLATAGRIRPTDLVWREGSGQRVLASRVKNLFADPPPQGPAGPGTPTPAPSFVAARPAQGAPAAAGRPAPEPRATASAPAAEETSAGSPDSDSAEIPATEPSQPLPQAARKGPAPQERQKRVVGIKGGTLVGQDGVKVLFRKKCSTCGYEEAARSSTFIKLGTSRIPFFCPKCRKARSVEINAVL
jgi:hypothetical protein